MIDEEQEDRLFKLMMLTAILCSLCFLGGFQFGRHIGHKDVPETVKLQMMEEVNKKANENALKQLKNVERE